MQTDNMQIDVLGASSMTTEQIRRKYVEPRTIKGPKAEVRGEITYTMSQNYQSVKVTVGVTLPVKASETEIISGQTYALILAKQTLEENLGTFMESLQSLGG